MPNPSGLNLPIDLGRALADRIVDLAVNTARPDRVPAFDDQAHAQLRAELRFIGELLEKAEAGALSTEHVQLGVDPERGLVLMFQSLPIRGRAQ